MMNSRLPDQLAVDPFTVVDEGRFTIGAATLRIGVYSSVRPTASAPLPISAVIGYCDWMYNRTYRDFDRVAQGLGSAAVTTTYGKTTTISLPAVRNAYGDYSQVSRTICKPGRNQVVWLAFQPQLSDGTPLADSGVQFVKRDAHSMLHDFSPRAELPDIAAAQLAQLQFEDYFDRLATMYPQLDSAPIQA